ncbi:MAG: rRNA (uracil1939-C5)-methyltransferase [Patescibacteria group bacterium]|nr:rRNA (uracil1939-C5)-methyltransferase [Patescibacteria group bacterium]
MAKFPVVRTTLDRIVGGGQSLGEHPDGRKLFVWGGLPGEVVDVQITKKRSRLAEGRVVEVISSSHERVEPRDPQSYLSTSPWQIMAMESELHYKAALIEEAFELHDIVLPKAIEVRGDNHRYNYRNKVEFSFYWDTEASQLELAFFIRGSKGKVAVDGTSLAQEPINVLARAIRDVLRAKSIEARSLKTLLIRCDVAGNCTWQLYVKDIDIEYISQPEAKLLQAQGGEIIYSDPKSPASRITERLATYGNTVLTDSILGIEFNYATEGFFQVNIPLYEMALRDMQKWLHPGPVLDMYSGVGTIGLTIGGTDLTLVELDPYAAAEMKQNIKRLGSSAVAVHAASEAALEHISPHATIILDPPRAGLHPDVIHRLVEQKPSRIIYLSCNPVTQARDVALLAEAYGIRAHTGYNFFPATPHIEHLVVLDLNA